MSMHEGHEGAIDDADGGLCLELEDMSVMFAPGTSVEDILTAVEDQPAGASSFVAQGSRWTYTATDGAVAEGEPITITYSFIPDGTSIPGAYDFTQAAPSVLFATLDAQFPGGRAAWKAKFAQAFADWSAHSNITFVEVSDDGATFPFALGALGQRGDVRIGMRAIGTPLAYNYYPNGGGDMVLDVQDIATFVNAANDFRSLRNVLMHEHGHGLGLAHVLPDNGTKLMEPFLNTSFDGAQEDDVRAVQHIYGDRFELNDEFASAPFIGGPLRDPVAGRVEFSVEDVALERDGSADFYAFTAFAMAPIAIRVEPVGTTYEFGPEDGTPTTIDARAARNLGVRLWRRVDAATNQFQMLAQIDFNAAGEFEYHPPIPYTTAGFMVAEVYSTDGVNDVQRYRMTIANGAIDPAAGTPELAVFAGAERIFDGSTVRPETTAVGASSFVTLTLRNDGDGVLEFTGSPTRATVAGPAAGDFGVIGVPATLDPGAAANVSIAFSPTAEGQRVAVVTIPNNDPAAEDFAFIVSATALPAPQGALEVFDGTVRLASAQALELGELLVGDAAAVDLALRNTGNAPLSVTGSLVVNAPLAGVSFSGLPVTIPAGQQRTLTIEAAPTSDGTFLSTIRLTTNGNPQTFDVGVALEAVAPIVNDCDGNGVEDADDIASGTAEDCDGNGVPDGCETDTDGDGRIDACDPFPNADETIDSDGDGTADVTDECPQDADKTAPGSCGCGVSDFDSDADGIPDCDDAFPTDPFNGGGATPDEPNEPVDPNTPRDEDAGDDAGNERVGDEDEGEEDLEDVPNLEDLTPIVPAPCGFGAGLATMLSLASLLGGGRYGRSRRMLLKR